MSNYCDKDTVMGRVTEMGGCLFWQRQARCVHEESVWRMKGARACVCVCECVRVCFFIFLVLSNPAVGFSWALKTSVEETQERGTSTHPGHNRQFVIKQNKHTHTHTHKQVNKKAFSSLLAGYEQYTSRCVFVCLYTVWPNITKHIQQINDRVNNRE